MGLSQSIQNFSEKIPNAISDKMKSAQEVAMRAQMERQLAMQNEMRKKQIAMQLAIAKCRFQVNIFDKFYSFGVTGAGDYKVPIVWLYNYL